MFRKTGRVAVLAAVLAAVGVMSVAAAASAAVFPLENFVVSGSLTPKALNQAIVLPEGGTFNGSATIGANEKGEIEGSVTGTVVVPPFKATISVLGIKTTVGVTFTQVGSTAGTIHSVAASNCNEMVGCVNLSVPTNAALGVNSVSILGITIPTKCETIKPAAFPLSTDLTIGELLTVGSHFKGTTNVPDVKCGGILGGLIAPVLDATLAGPASYALNITPH